MSYKCRRWSLEDDERLVAMFIEGESLRDMRKELDRTKDAISMRRLKLQREGRCPAQSK